MSILLQATQPSGWGDPGTVISAIVAGVIALSGVILSIIALLKSGGAQKTADANSKAITSTQADVRSVNEQLTAVATSTPAPDLLAATKKALESQP